MYQTSYINKKKFIVTLWSIPDNLGNNGSCDKCNSKIRLYAKDHSYLNNCNHKIEDSVKSNISYQE